MDQTQRNLMETWAARFALNLAQQRDSRLSHETRYSEALAWAADSPALIERMQRAGVTYATAREQHRRAIAEVERVALALAAAKPLSQAWQGHADLLQIRKDEATAYKALDMALYGATLPGLGVMTDVLVGNGARTVTA